jgi:CBS domain containing-hemolysin-like protein
MEIIAGLLLILATGFYAGSETGVYRANWIRLTNWASRNLSGAGLALRLLDARDTTIVAALVGTNLAGVFATELFSRFFEHNFGPAYVSVAVVLVVILTLVLGDYWPKAIAQAYPDRWLRRAALPLAVSKAAFAPVVVVLSGIARFFAGALPGSGQRFTLTRQDFLAAVRRRGQNEAAGAEARHVTNMVARLFRFSGVRVAEIAIPIEEVKTVPGTAGLNEVLAVIGRYGFSRIPVFQGEPTNITGVIVAKDLLAAPTYRVRKVNRVSENTRAMEVLSTMQRRGEHLALVEDGSHRVTGIVTLEDLLEELVGEIRSEQ